MIKSIFNFSPLNSSLILSTSWKQIFGIIWKFDMSDMLRMTSIFVWFVTIEQWVSIDTDKSIVISWGDQLLVFCHAHRIDVRSITTRWEYSLHIPTKFACLITPDTFHCVCWPTRISFFCKNIEEKKLICSTNWSDKFGINRPV